MLSQYVSLDSLQTRIDTHHRYSEIAHDVDATVIATLALRPGGSLLDIGFGTGSFLRRLGDGFALTGVDTSDAALAAADGFTARWADAQDLPFEDGSFDAVTARHMLYHVPDPVRAISEARRVLRPGGVFTAVVNIENALPGIFGLLDEAVTTHGIAHSFHIPVHSGNLPELVTTVFGRAEVQRHDNALVFAEPEPVIAYAVSCLSAFGVTDDDPRRPSIVDTVVTLAKTKPVSRDPKGFIVVTAKR